MTRVDDSDARGGGDCRDHQWVDGGTCGICHEREGVTIECLERISSLGPWLCRPSTATVIVRSSEPLSSAELRDALAHLGHVSGAAPRIAEPGWNPAPVFWGQLGPSMDWTAHLRADTIECANALEELPMRSGRQHGG